MPLKRIHPWRVALATSAMLLPCAAVVIALRSLPDGVPAAVLAVVGGVVCTLVVASILEWVVHRYIYHRRRAPWQQIYRIHHQGHHAAIFPTWRYTTNGPVRRHPIGGADISSLYPAGWRNGISKAAHTLFYLTIACVFLWLPAWFLTQNRIFVSSIVLTSIVVSDLFVRVHDAIHYPNRFKFIESQPWFPFIDRHHFIHHVDMEANVNFLLPLADWCYGTLRRTLTPSEIEQHGTLQDAKSTPMGYSEPASAYAATRKGRRQTTGIP